LTLLSATGDFGSGSQRWIAISLHGKLHSVLGRASGSYVTGIQQGGFLLSGIAFAINPAGEITGLFCDDIGCHAFLATPQSGQVSTTIAVPATARRFWPLSHNLHRLGKGGLARLLLQR
jgi:hypothetical protein